MRQRESFIARRGHSWLIAAWFVPGISVVAPRVPERRGAFGHRVAEHVGAEARA